MTATGLILETYLARIGADRPAQPSLTALRIIVGAHAAAIPFENLDIVFGRPIRLDIASIQAKLVDARRGGYCFEHNTLLQTALQAIGFEVTSLMARVVRGGPADAMTSLTHMCLNVALPQGNYLADVGFGNLTPTAPLAFDRTDAQPTGHEAFRLLPMQGRHAGEMLLQARLGDTWEALYRFARQPSSPIDHEVANWFTSTRPGDLFTENMVVALPGTACRKTLFNGEMTIRDMDNNTHRSRTDGADSLRMALNDQFGIVLDLQDLMTLDDATRRMAQRPGPTLRLD